MRATPPVNQSLKEIDAGLGLNESEKIYTPLDSNESEEIQTASGPNESEEIHTQLDQNEPEEIYTQEIQTTLNKSEETWLSSELKEPEPSKQLTTKESKWLPTKSRVATYIIIAFIAIALSIGLASVWADKARFEVMEECAKEKSKIEEKIEICFEKKKRDPYKAIGLITHSEEECKEENAKLKKDYRDRLTKLIEEIAKLEGKLLQVKEENINLKGQLSQIREKYKRLEKGYESSTSREENCSNNLVKCDKDAKKKLLQLKEENTNLKGQLSQIREKYKRLEKDYESSTTREENCSNNFVKCDKDAKKKQKEWKEKEDGLEAKVLEGNSRLEECNKHIKKLQVTLSDCQKRAQAFQSRNEEPPVFIIIGILIAVLTGAVYCICLASK